MFSNARSAIAQQAAAQPHRSQVLHPPNRSTLSKSARAVELQPISSADVPAVAKFLHAELNTRIASAEWEAAITPPWVCGQPNHGFLLRAGERIVGVYLAFYSERKIDGQTER